MLSPTSYVAFERHLQALARAGQLTSGVASLDRDAAQVVCLVRTNSGLTRHAVEIGEARPEAVYQRCADALEQLSDASRVYGAFKAHQGRDGASRAVEQGAARA